MQYNNNTTTDAVLMSQVLTLKQSLANKCRIQFIYYVISY